MNELRQHNSMADLRQETYGWWMGGVGPDWLPSSSQPRGWAFVYLVACISVELFMVFM